MCPDWVRCSHPFAGMTASPTTRVEIDTDLLDRLRKRRPERNARELLESAARIQLRREAIVRVRKHFSGVPMEEIESEASRRSARFAANAPPSGEPPVKHPRSGLSPEGRPEVALWL